MRDCVCSILRNHLHLLPSVDTEEELRRAAEQTSGLEKGITLLCLAAIVEDTTGYAMSVSNYMAALHELAIHIPDEAHELGWQLYSWHGW